MVKVKETEKSKEIKLSTANVFSQVSELYDSGRNKFFSDFGKLAVEKMDIKPGSKILDIASGRGAILFPAYEQVGLDGEVIGIDFSKGMVETTTKAIEEKKCNIELLQMDAEKLEFEDNSFDYIFCGFALFFFPNLDLALAEISRVLKPKGKFCASTFLDVPDYDEDWFFDLRKKYSPGPKKLEGSTPSAESTPKSESRPVFDTVEGMGAIFENSGFKNMKFFNEGKDYYYTEDEWWEELFSHGGRRFMDRLTPENLELFKEDVYKQLRLLKGDKGIYRRSSVLLTYGEK